MERIEEYKAGNLRSPFENWHKWIPRGSKLPNYSEVEHQQFNNHINPNVLGDIEIKTYFNLSVLTPIMLIVIAAIFIMLLILIERKCCKNKDGLQLECSVSESENTIEYTEVKSESSISVKAPEISTKSWVQHLEVSVIKHSHDGENA